MAELLRAREPLGGLAATGAGVSLTPRSGLGLATVIARKGAGPALKDRARLLYELELPDGPERASQGELAFIGVGPGLWLAVQDGGRDTLAGMLSRDLGGLASISDQASAYVVIRLSGPQARQTLAKRVAIDLHPRAFGPGDAAVTSFGLMNAVLWPVAEGYELAVSRSFAEDAWRGLVHDSAEFNAA